jgi:hypothetical protein
LEYPCDISSVVCLGEVEDERRERFEFLKRAIQEAEDISSEEVVGKVEIDRTDVSGIGGSGSKGLYELQGFD